MHTIPEEPSDGVDSTWDYIFIVTSVWDRELDALNTENPLNPDADEYVDVDDGPRYLVRFGDGMVELAGLDGAGSFSGTLGAVGATFDTYTLDNGWAGGSLTVRYDGSTTTAHLEINGSGVPVVISERGILVPFDEG
jgi:hypothetical protein